jgi:hypothetical protein
MLWQNYIYLLDVVFSGYHRNVGTIRTPNAADSPRRLHQVHSPRMHQELYILTYMRVYIYIYQFIRIYTH